MFIDFRSLVQEWRGNSSQRSIYPGHVWSLTLNLTQHWIHTLWNGCCFGVFMLCKARQKLWSSRFQWPVIPSFHGSRGISSNYCSSNVNRIWFTKREHLRWWWRHNVFCCLVSLNTNFVRIKFSCCENHPNFIKKMGAMNHQSMRVVFDIA